MSVNEKFLQLTTKSGKLYKRAQKSMPSGTTRGVIFYRPYPFYAAKGRGSHIWDIDGNNYIDYMLNASVLILGHSHPKVVTAIKEQLENDITLGAPTELEIKLSEKIVEMVPCAERVRFAVTGSEACMNALRVARAYTGRNKVIMFEGYYHGTYDPLVSKAGVYHSEGIAEDTSRNIITLPFNNSQILEKVIKEGKKDEIAAVMLEPVIGSGGGIPGTVEFLKSCREITEKNDILLLFDEVQTGFRLAAGGAQERFGVVPDIVALGKGVGGGLPGSAYCGREDIMEKTCGYPETTSPLKSHPLVPPGGTHNAHPLTMVAGLAHLNELKKPVFEHIDRMGASLRDELAKIASDLGIGLQTTGLGSFFNMYFTKRSVNNYKDTKYADPLLLWYFDLSLLNKGVYLAPAHCCYTCAAMSDDDLKLTLKAMENTLIEMKPIIKNIAPDLIL